MKDDAVLRDTAGMSGFIHELKTYSLLRRAGLDVPRHGVVRGMDDLSELPFQPGDPVVFKGLVDGLWHKSDLGLVRFGPYEASQVEALARELEAGAAGHGDWVGMFVAEQIPFARVPGLPTEALFALRKSPDAGWTVVAGLGGVLANPWGEEIPPRLWPHAFTTPEQAFEEFREHFLGRVWLGTLRQGQPLVEEPVLRRFFEGLWALPELLDREGAILLELNPVVPDPSGRLVPLDGVGLVEDPPSQPRQRWALAPEELLRILVRPQSIGLAGISSREGTPGHLILENLLRSSLPKEALLPIKPGTAELLGLPCLSGMGDLAARPVDLLILCLPAPKAVEAIEQLCAQGGGASVVYLVSGGIGDGGDHEGWGQHLGDLLAERRQKELWTPVVVGPNGLGFLSAEGHINTLFISKAKFPFLAEGGPLALVSQSGAFLITRLSAMPELPLRFGVSIGNQLDVRLSDFIEILSLDEGLHVVAAYVEGFQPGDLSAVARAAQKAEESGTRVLMYKGGRTAQGQAAASSHTGALAGDWDLQKALLKRAGVLVTESLGVFDAALAWLSAYPEGRPRHVAVVTAAGFESVVSADILQGSATLHELSGQELEILESLLEQHGLQGLVAPRIPLDLTPMADEGVFLDCARLLAASGADTLLFGMVAFTSRLETQDSGKMGAFAEALAALARTSGKRIGVAVEGGLLFQAYRQAFAQAGLPVFTSAERALMGLRLLSGD